MLHVVLYKDKVQARQLSAPRFEAADKNVTACIIILLDFDILQLGSINVDMTR